MVELQQIDSPFEPSLASLASAIDEALASGVSPSEILHMVAASFSPLAEQPKTSNSSPDDQECPIYTELPEGLIDLPSAAEKYGIHRSSLRRWVDTGHLKVHGRLRGSARGGGFLILSENQVIEHMNAPKNKGGRPRKQ